jgi:hypothetical protein
MQAQIDHYVGRAVVEVIPGQGEDNQWAIRLEGDVLIRNYDKDIEIPPEELVGTAFLSVDYATTVAPITTTISFGYSSPEGTYSGEGGVQIVAEIPLHEYTVVAPGSEDPQAEEVALPPDPSPERVADGPENPEEQDEAAPQAL